MVPHIIVFEEKRMWGRAWILRSGCPYGSSIGLLPCSSGHPLRINYDKRNVKRSHVLRHHSLRRNWDSSHRNAFTTCGDLGRDGLHRTCKRKTSVYLKLEEAIHMTWTANSRSLTSGSCSPPLPRRGKMIKELVESNEQFVTNYRATVCTSST
jgi:hypothetical protein